MVDHLLLEECLRTQSFDPTKQPISKKQIVSGSMDVQFGADMDSKPLRFNLHVSRPFLALSQSVVDFGFIAADKSLSSTSIYAERSVFHVLNLGNSTLSYQIEILEPADCNIDNMGGLTQVTLLKTKSSSDNDAATIGVGDKSIKFEV